jgi:hypothetical protein
MMGRGNVVTRVLTTLLVLALCVRVARARNPEQPETAPPPGGDMTFLDHSGKSPFWFGAEFSSILQLKPSFDALYTGQNSLRPESESAISGLATVFLAFRPHRTTELIVDLESALGGGLSNALGLGGFTNLDVVRNPTLSSLPYVARAEIHQIIPLSPEWVPNVDRGPTTSAWEVPLHRIELRAGKLAVPDLFDINPAGSDSHSQFMNWAVDQNGAYDFAADTRGYTLGFVVEYQGPRLEARFGEMLMPKVANGIDLDFDITNSRAENAELEIKYSLVPGRAGTLRILTYVNHANMGNYQQAINAYQSGEDRQPDITAHRKPGNAKYGFGLNLFQEVSPLIRAFARIGWNDGLNESFAYTEIDNTFEVGADMLGVRWRRPEDRLGLAFVTNGISDNHQEYLRLGGHGFILGDAPATFTMPGKFLSYGRETIIEEYYNFHIWRGAFAAQDIQWIANPGYNADRGPVWVFSFRGHLEF